MSVFSEHLRALLDDTNFFDRQEWPQYLGRTAEKIEEWLADKSIPKPSDLNMIVIGLEHYDVNKAPLEEFKKIENLRATTISPLGALMLPTVREYYKRPIFGELANQLARRWTDEEKIEFLLKEFPE